MLTYHFFLHIFIPRVLFQELPDKDWRGRALSFKRVIFYEEDDLVWYLGERVTRQFDTSLLLVPHDPLATILDMDALERAVHDEVLLRVDYREFVHHGLYYATEL